MASSNNIMHKYLKIFWIIFLSPFALLTLLLLLISIGWLGYIPNWEELENPNINIASEIISFDNQLLGQYYLPKNNRSMSEYKDLSPTLIEALITTEDIRYYNHSGIDGKGLIRMIAFLGTRGGASTITQQLAKLLYHDQPTSRFIRVWQKLNEWVIAVKLERKYTKEEIISLYLNQFDFNNQAVGIKSAARIYFNTTTDSLTFVQSATLVGMLKNPILYNPVKRPDTTLFRRNVVLAQMEKYGKINSIQYKDLTTKPLELTFQEVDHNLGLAPYFREYLRLIMNANEPNRKRYVNYSSYQEDSLEWARNPLFGWCVKNKKPDGTPYNLYRDGLKIYTTIDYRLQQYAEEGMKEHMAGFLQPAFDKEKKGKRYAPFSVELSTKDMQSILDRSMIRSERYRIMREAGVSADSIKRSFSVPSNMTIFSWSGDIDTIMTPLDSIKYYKSFLRTGIISIEPTTGFVKVYVGNINMKHFKYDNAKIGKNQVGSTFKPFLYALAMKEGYTPCSKVLVVPQTFKVNDTIWIPRSTCKPEDLNTYKTLRWGLANSENYVSAWLLKQFNPESIVELAHKIGIESPVEAVPSMIYGVSNMSVYEMVSAYSTFADKGVHIKPIMVTRIEDKNGNVLAKFMSEKEDAINENTAYLMIQLMRGVVDGGTAGRLRSQYQFTAPIAGKTGTTNDFSDGWFIGIVPKLVTGIWVGGEERPVRFDSWLGQGASMAMPIWANFMKKVYKDPTLGLTELDQFEVPGNFNINLNCTEGTDDNNGYEEYNYEQYNYLKEDYGGD